MFSLKDRFDKRYALGPTHEELFAIAGKMKVKSYKDLPFSLYQFQNKFRDEPRPRYGLIRVREFIMKDAYTFDKDYEGLDVSYQKMYNAYKSAFDRLGLNYTIVEADTGAMGGLLSEEFQAISDIGEDTLVLCSKCDYASNLEIAECLDTKIDNDEPLLSKELIHTPNAKTIEEVANFMNERADKFVKTILYKVDDKVVACLVKGNREINEVKLRRLLKTGSIELLDFETVKLITGAKVGFAGPIDLPVPIIIDNEIKYMKNFIVGANKTDYHYKNVNLTDFNYDLVSDIRYLDAEDGCVKCGAPLVFKKGIEVGNTFKLGTKYADTLGLTYLAADNKLNSVVMGSYGIGLGRCMAAIVEQNHDDKGIIWPMMVAPYQVAIVVVDTNDELQMKVANDLYTQLTDLKIDTILDDRDERIGVKFNDMDLIGIPIRITIGKIVKEEKIEFKLRTGQTEEIKLVDVINRIDEQIKKTIK